MATDGRKINGAVLSWKKFLLVSSTTYRPAGIVAKSQIRKKKNIYIYVANDHAQE